MGNPGSLNNIRFLLDRKNLQNRKSMILKELIPGTQAQKDEFANKVAQIAYSLQISPDWLMAVMYKESSLNHQAVNRVSGATGLIQFMPSTAQGLGTSTQALKTMSAVQQLDYVKKYFLPYAGDLASYTDTYLAVFFPAAIGKESGYILRTSTLPAELIATQNPAMDVNKDFAITKQEVETWALSGFPQTIQEILKKKHF
jgi:hypothetical protein